MTTLATFVDVLRRGAAGCCFVGMLLCVASAQTPQLAEPAPETSRAASDQRPGGGTEMTAPVPNAAPDFGALLPRDLSPWGMFLTAHIVVQAVMIGLAF